ncbi:MAG: SPOR domain-containing protein [Pseudomonadales bacterium]|nr:SPOR domain-containing protein [Pseudomonadales bacterium]
MDTRLRQRVVGAGVLTTLAIIILPMLLDGTSEDRARVMSTMPEPPVIELQRLTVDDVRRQMRKMEQDSAALLPMLQADEPLPGDVAASAAVPANASNALAKKHFALDKNLLPVSWTLQLGSFQNPENAMRLRQQLREADYRSYIIHSKAEGQNSDTFRVYLGPMLQKQDLEKIAAAVKVQFELDGQIVRYRIEDDTGQLGG